MPQLDTVDEKVNNYLGTKDLERLHDDIKSVMSSPQGRAVMSSIFETFGLRRNVFSANGSQMAFNAGKQAVCEWIFGQIVAADCYDLYGKMEKETFDRLKVIELEKQKLVEKFRKDGKL